MGFEFKPVDLFRAPMVNPINRKARSIPLLNPVNIYGRVFFFSWFGFMIAFWAWYAFPPLVRGNPLSSDLHISVTYAAMQLTVTVKDDLSLSAAQVANSNIVSLCAT